MGEGGDFIAHERQAALNVRRRAAPVTPVKQSTYFPQFTAGTGA